jgi:hypothetical protein
MRRSILAVCLLATAQPSHAAQIAVSHDKPGLPVIGINGSIEAADVDRLNAVVFLRSRMALPYKLARS